MSSVLELLHCAGGVLDAASVSRQRPHVLVALNPTLFLEAIPRKYSERKQFMREDVLVGFLTNGKQLEAI